MHYPDPSRILGGWNEALHAPGGKNVSARTSPATASEELGRGGELYRLAVRSHTKLRTNLPTLSAVRGGAACERSSVFVGCNDAIVPSRS